MKLFNKFKYIIFKIAVDIKSYFIAVNFKNLPSTKSTNNCIMHTLSLNDDFLYKDETWKTIKNFCNQKHKNSDDENTLCSLRTKGNIQNDVLIINTPKIQNNWLCFFYKHPLKNHYTFDFDITIQNTFKEIQIAFKYKDLANRLRFMIRNNNEAVFEVIKNGIFYKRVHTKPYSLKPGSPYHFSIDVKDNEFRFCINNENIFLIKQTFKINSFGNELCLILYNDTDSDSIKCEITNVQIDNYNAQNITTNLKDC